MAQTSLLTATTIRNLKEAGKYHDGGGLYLILSATGAKRWELLINHKNRRTQVSLGADNGLAVARTGAAQIKTAVKEGADPKAAAKAFREGRQIEPDQKLIPTFNMCMEEVLQIKEAELKNDKHKAQWRSSLKTYACPHIGTMPVDQITITDIENLLKPIWYTITETADRVRSRIEKVLAYAIVKKHREPFNPATWPNNLEFLFPKKNELKGNNHHNALPYDELPEFMLDLRAKESITARLLEFTILTTSRTQESLGALWSEIDFEKRLWTVPAERMKAKKQHRVPLTDRMISLLKSLPRFDDEPYIFPSPRTGKLSNMAMLKFLKQDLGYSDLTVHGFRSTFKDWAVEETSFAGELSEAQLAHTIKNKSQAAYERGEKLKRRTELMDVWDAYCMEAE